MSWILLKKLDGGGQRRGGAGVSQYRTSAICSTEEELRAEIKNRKEVGHLGSVLAQIRREREWTEKSYLMRSAEIQRRSELLGEKMDAIQEEAQIKELEQVECIVRMIEDAGNISAQLRGQDVPSMFPPMEEQQMQNGGAYVEMQGEDEVDSKVEKSIINQKNSDEGPFITALPREETALTAVTNANLVQPEITESGKLPTIHVMGEKRKHSDDDLKGKCSWVKDVQKADQEDPCTPRKVKNHQDISEQDKDLLQTNNEQKPKTNSANETLLLPQIHNLKPISESNSRRSSDSAVLLRPRDTDVGGRRRKSRVSLDMSGIDFKKNPTYSEKLIALRRRVSQIETDEMKSRVQDFVREHTEREKKARTAAALDALSGEAETSSGSNSKLVKFSLDVIT